MELKYYKFEYTFAIEGVVESDMTIEEARDKLNRDLAMIYGPDGVRISDFREANPDETEMYLSQKAESELSAEQTLN